MEAKPPSFIPFQLWYTVPQLLGSLDKGLFIFFPILILGVFGWKEFASRYRPEAVLCGGLLVGNLVLAGDWTDCGINAGCIEAAVMQIFTKIQVPASTAGWGEATQVFDVLDQALEKGPWILGEDFSVADIMIGSGLNFAINIFKMVPTRPSFDRYLARCIARPGFQRAMALAA